MSISIIELDSCASTNAELAAMPDAADGTVVATRSQTAGRGQRGNSWEAELGKNLTFSQLIRPTHWHASRQFEISMLVALAVADTLDSVFADAGCVARTKVKWPNDIYVDDSKICGILIENRLCGSMIESSIAGIGIDVNQRVFTSDAPNPISVIHFTEREEPLRPLLEKVCTAIAEDCRAYFAAPDAEALRRSFMSRLYRGDGREYLFREPGGEPFAAAITDIALTGHLSLSNGRTYAFKEIAYVI